MALARDISGQICCCIAGTPHNGDVPANISVVSLYEETFPPTYSFSSLCVQQHLSIAILRCIPIEDIVQCVSKLF